MSADGGVSIEKAETIPLGFFCLILPITINACSSEVEVQTPAEPVSRVEEFHWIKVFERWADVAGNDQAIKQLEVLLGLGGPDPAPETFSFYGKWAQGPDPLEVRVRGAARKDTGEITRLSVFGVPRGSPFDKKKLDFLQPFYDVLVAVVDPTLTKKDRTAILDQLLLSPELESELEKAHRENQTLIVTKNGIEYKVKVWGSEEGGTVKLEAIIVRAGDSLNP